MATIPMDISDPITRAARALNEGGVPHLVKRVFQKMSSPLVEFGSIIFFMRELDEALPQSRATIELRVRNASPSDLCLLLEARAMVSVDALRDRFQRGDLCFIAQDDEGRVVHSRWVATRHAYIPELGMDVVLGPGEVYVYDSYTRPDSRGRGIDGVVRCFTFNWLHSAGFKKAYSYVRGDNPLGLRAARRWLQFVGRLWYLQLLGLRPLAVGRIELPVLTRTVFQDRRDKLSTL